VLSNLCAEDQLVHGGAAYAAALCAAAQRARRSMRELQKIEVSAADRDCG